MTRNDLDPPFGDDPLDEHFDHHEIFGPGPAPLHLRWVRGEIMGFEERSDHVALVVLIEGEGHHGAVMLQGGDPDTIHLGRPVDMHVGEVGHMAPFFVPSHTLLVDMVAPAGSMTTGERARIPTDGTHRSFGAWGGRSKPNLKEAA